MTLPILLLLPGAWVSFGLRLDGLSTRGRLCLGGVLSPLVVAVQVCGLKLCGLGFGHAVPLVVAAAVPSILLIVKRRPRRRTRWDLRYAIVGLVLFLVFVLCAASPWLHHPDYRVFSRHGLLHAEICYAVCRDTVIPEEPQLAGLRLCYPWVGHLYWSVIGWACNWPPTVVWAVTNVSWLAAISILCYETIRLLGVHRSTAILGVGLLVLGTNLLGRVGPFVASGFGAWTGRVAYSDVRYSPFLLKFIESNQMPIALAMFAGLTYVVVANCSRCSKSLSAVASILLGGLGLIYPIVFPAAALLVLCLIARMFFARLYGRLEFGRSEIVALMCGFLVAVILTAGFVITVFADRVQAPFRIGSLRGVLSRLIDATVVFGPLAIPVLLVARASNPRRKPGCLVLLGGFLAAVMLNGVLRMEGRNEYKFILCAAICLAPLTGVGLDPVMRRLRRAQWVVALGVPAILALLMLPVGRLMIPRELAQAPRIDEGSFWIDLDASVEQATWTRAVRERTPADTILVVHRSDLPLPAYTARSIFVDTEAIALKPGYGWAVRDNLVRIRGYASDTYDQRADLVNTLYTSRDPLTLRKRFDELCESNRPLAIHFSRKTDFPFLRWLKEERLGMLLVAEKGHLVWFIDPISTGRKAKPEGIGMAIGAAQ